jgi:hypothetical protein
MPPSAATSGCRRPPFRQVFDLKKKKKKKKLKEAKDAHKRGRSCPPKEAKDSNVGLSHIAQVLRKPT